MGLRNLLGGMGDSENIAQRDLPSSRQANRGALLKFASNEFVKFNATVSWQQRIGENLTALFRFEGQYSPTLLTLTEQYFIGSSSNVRAYPVSELLMDSAFFASMEWTADSPGLVGQPSPFKNLNWDDVLHVSFFANYAMGRLRAPNSTDEAAIAVAGYGMGLSVTLSGEFTGWLQASQPFELERQPTDNHTVHYWFDFTNAF